MLPKPPMRAPKPKRPIQRKARVKKHSDKGMKRSKLDLLMGELVKVRGECEAQKKCAGIHPSKLVLQSAHGWGKKAYPATRYVRENLFSLCSKCHSYFSWKAHEWVEWMQQHMAPDVYDRVRRMALANEKLDYAAIETDLRRKVDTQRARLRFASELAVSLEREAEG